MDYLFFQSIRPKCQILHNGSIIIENYNEIIDIKTDIIITTYFTIKGSSIRISKLDKYLIEIKGNVEEVIVNRED